MQLVYNKIIVIVLLLLCISFVLSKNYTTEKTIDKSEYKLFNSFLDTFYLNKSFQKSRIVNSLQGGLRSWDTDAIGLLVSENWQEHVKDSIPIPSHIELLNKYSNLSHKLQRVNDTIFIEMSYKECKALSFQKYFIKNKNKWYLVRYDVNILW